MRKYFLVTILIVVLIFAVDTFLQETYVLPILMYHNINYKAGESKLSVTPESFERQMRFLRKHNYHILSLDKAADLIASGKRIPYKTVAITFDDGNLNNYTHGFPVLKRYKIPATIFIITSKAGEETFVSWEQILEMHEAGVDFGSHTISHEWLPSFTDEELKEEVFTSRQILEEKLNTAIRSFSYPMGAYDERVKEMVKKAGYRLACATNPGPKSGRRDLYALKRVRISRTSDNLLVFWIESSGWYTFIKEIRDEE